MIAAVVGCLLLLGVEGAGATTPSPNLADHSASQWVPSVGGPLELRVPLPMTDASSTDRAKCTNPASIAMTVAPGDAGFVWASDRSACVEVNYALFQAGSVKAVTWTTAPAGTVLVNVVLNRRELSLFRGAVRSAGNQGLVLVALNQILSNYEAGPDTGPSIQVMGGLNRNDRRPLELAHALRAPLLEVTPSRSNPGPDVARSSAFEVALQARQLCHTRRAGASALPARRDEHNSTVRRSSRALTSTIAPSERRLGSRPRL